MSVILLKCIFPFRDCPWLHTSYQPSHRPRSLFFSLFFHFPSLLNSLSSATSFNIQFPPNTQPHSLFPPSQDFRIDFPFFPNQIQHTSSIPFLMRHSQPPQFTSTPPKSSMYSKQASFHLTRNILPFFFIAQACCQSVSTANDVIHTCFC